MKFRQSLFSAALGLSSLLGLSSPQAATITPNIFTDPAIGSDNVNCSLRYAVEAINLASNATVPGCTVVGSFGTDDTIVLGEGIYELTLSGEEDDNQTGDLDILDGNDTPVTIQGAGADLTTIDASGIDGGDRVIDVEGIEFTITDMTLTGGNANGSDGGALQFDESIVLAQRLIVTGNVAGEGGGISYDGNDFDGDQMILEDSTVEDNEVTGSLDNGVDDCLGGGIENEDGLMAIVNSTVNNNRSPSGSGGGICDLGNYLFMINSTVSGNSAETEGGGIFTSGGLKGVYNVTITLNSAETGGGLFKVQPAAVPAGGNFDDPRFETQIFNTIVAQNTASGSGPECFGAYGSGGNNLIGQIGPNDNCTGFADGVNDDQVGTDTAPIDALLGPLADNGGPTQTHALLTGSPAIDRGNPNGCEALDVEAFNPDNFEDPLTFFTLTEDQRGETRPVAILDPSVPVCDIGAYELQVIQPTPTPTPTPTATPTPTPPFQGFIEGSGCSLNRAAGAPAAASLWLALGLAAGFLGLKKKARD
ncbi:MAG TPA: choice-of-anchor Q domain-containing protein [bacterium]|nr:choice-of-anchor Q domain-containing protein [bacterium]